jgi:hydrogenase expression/formation protein HypD
VSLVIGTAPYEFIACFYRKPMVVAGFEPLDVLQSIWMVPKQLAESRCEIENQYARIVPEAGNSPALRAVGRVYELREFFEWRGLGSIDHSGVRMRAQYARFDADGLLITGNVAAWPWRSWRTATPVVPGMALLTLRPRPKRCFVTLIAPPPS